jgi:hypothetical protein
MINTYRFTYESRNYEPDSDSPFPSSTTVEVEHQFEEGQTWEAVMWQFARFLEHTGYEGVRKRIKIDLAKSDDWLFDKCPNHDNFDEVLADLDQIEPLDRRDGDAT